MRQHLELPLNCRAHPLPSLDRAWGACVRSKHGLIVKFSRRRDASWLELVKGPCRTVSHRTSIVSASPAPATDRRHARSQRVPHRECLRQDNDLL